MSDTIFFTECPRDALQGLKTFVPTDLKVRYVRALMDCGFNALDFTSFVSPAAVPQMADADHVCALLETQLPSTRPQLIAIVGNTTGAERAGKFPWIDRLGYPHSVSETFLKRNINSTRTESLNRLLSIRDLAGRNGQKVVVYLSMAFGNPYGDSWSVEEVCAESQRLFEMGFDIVSLSDTTAMGTPDSIHGLFQFVHQNVPGLNLGLHLHVKPTNLRAVLEAAWEAGCRRFDGALGGFGGCPMAADTLTGNLPSEAFGAFVAEKLGYPIWNPEALENSQKIAREIFGNLN